MKYYMLAGEASGDLHGANLIKALLKLDSDAKFRFWGGDLMQRAANNLVVHYKERAFMGFAEVLFNLKKIVKLISLCKKDIAQYHPDVIVLIDNSGFNLRIAKWAKKQGFKTNYYISPQVWASRASRIKVVKKYIDQMFVILPFEKSFYKKHNCKVTFVGHPLIDAIQDRENTDEQKFRAAFNITNKNIIALLPGSRKQEISKILPVMLSLVDNFCEYQFVLAGAPGQSYSFYKPFIKNKNIVFIPNKTHDLLSVSHAALVASGTATLETALFKVPQVVCYKTSKLSYIIAKRLIKLKYISLVNLIMNKKVVTELIQNYFNSKNLNHELKAILNPVCREQLFLDYFTLETKLGGKGASEKTAKLIIKGLNQA